MTRSESGEPEFDLSSLLREFRSGGDRPRLPPGLVRALIPAAVALLLIAAVLVGANLYTDLLWFRSVDYESVYWTRLGWRFGSFAVAGLTFFLLAGPNLWLARRLAPKGALEFVPREELIESRSLVLPALLAGSLLVALFFASIAADSWDLTALAVNAKSFALEEPIFGSDVSFYVFQLPFLRFLHAWLLGTALLITVAVGSVYGVSAAIRGASWTAFGTRATAHLSILSASVMGLLAWNFALEINELVFSERGAFFGAGYTDLNAQLLAQRILVVVAILAVVLFVANVFVSRGYVLPALAVGAVVLAAVLVGNAYPSAVQQFQVTPNELEREEPFLANHIRFTTKGFNLDGVEEIEFPASESLSLDQIRRNPATLDNVRPWDPRPLKETYNQIQSIRLYYAFNDIDIDRYTIDDDYRQVMISARELLVEELQEQAQTWVNQRLQFTHGYGAAVTPVNEVSPEGLPVLFLKDLPPRGSFDVTRPEIYYGERSSDYVIVKTRTQEFDYPSGDLNVFTTYKEDSGVLLDSPLRRLAYAWAFRDLNILISEQLTEESAILYRRQVAERIGEVAPFLVLDQDPYIVIRSDGRLTWIIDGYTVSDHYPHSQPHPDGINYIRNPVKATVDAYNGNVRLYVVDPTDPIIRTWGNVFSGLLRPFSELPSDLREHLRYPEDMFSIQAEMYRNYHMKDPRVFYNREDSYRVPREVFDQNEQEMVPYFVIIKLPGEENEEFLLMLPFTPAGDRNNTISWLAGRADGENYGKLLAYQLPKDKLVFGPLQVESRITQNPQISAQFSLWSQSDSRVIRGNLIMIPIEDWFLYIEPVFLQAETSSIPELKRVIVATGSRIAMEPSLEQSIEVLYGLRQPSGFDGTTTTVPVTEDRQPTPASSLPPAPTTPPERSDERTAAELARSAAERYDRAQNALRAGDFAAYGEEMTLLEDDLRQLLEVTGG